MKIIRLCCLLAAFAIASSASVTAAADAGTQRFPVLKKLPRKTQDALATMMEWQRSFVDLKARELRVKLGNPDRMKDLGPNAATGKPMQMFAYRLSRRSELQFTIHEGEVLAVSAILLPSGNEEGPIDEDGLSDEDGPIADCQLPAARSFLRTC